MPTEQEILEKIEFEKERVRVLNEELHQIRGPKEVPTRMGLIWNNEKDLMVVDIAKVEVFHADMESVTIIGKISDIIPNPNHIDIHNIIHEFLKE